MPLRGSLLVEGWRFIAHSYALANQYQLLELRSMTRLYHRDLPFYNPGWSVVRGLLDAEDERVIADIPAPGIEDQPEAVYRIGFPYDLAPCPGRPTLVYGTSEYGVVPDDFIASGRPLRRAMLESDCVIVAPSQWSREGFIRSGADPDRVRVVPHGADVRVFKPLPESERPALRTALGVDGFAFLAIGAMTTNKGITSLLKAFAAILERHPSARLLLKGLDALYPSKDFLLEAAKHLTSAECARVQARLLYFGDIYNARQLAGLYQAADAYVSPYRAEGFNLPVLEAAACGTLSICTAGGPTDDFTTEDFAMRIHSREGVGELGPDSRALEPDLEHLVELMRRAIEMPALAQRARVAGPRHVASGFTWRHAAHRLLELALPRH